VTFTEAMTALAEMLPEQGDDPRLRVIANEVARLTKENGYLQRSVMNAESRLARAERVVKAAGAVEVRLRPGRLRPGATEGWGIWADALRTALAEWRKPWAEWRKP